VADWANEIMSLSEGWKSGKLTANQERFVKQYFEPLAKDPEEFNNQQRERFVTRDEMLGGYTRWVTEGKGNPDRLRKLARYLSEGYDKYVHGGYITAMELYDGISNTFMLRGREKEIAKRATASKLHHALTALLSMAEAWRLPALIDEICRAGLALHASGELS
jgi:hypothetical protein